MSTNQEIYQGFWVNHAEGPIVGATVTLSTSGGAYLIAFLARTLRRKRYCKTVYCLLIEHALSLRPPRWCQFLATNRIRNFPSTSLFACRYRAR